MARFRWIEPSVELPAQYREVLVAAWCREDDDPCHFLAYWDGAEWKESGFGNTAIEKDLSLMVAYWSDFPTPKRPKSLSFPAIEPPPAYTSIVQLGLSEGTQRALLVRGIYSLDELRQRAESIASMLEDQVDEIKACLAAHPEDCEAVAQ